MHSLSEAPRIFIFFAAKSHGNFYRAIRVNAGFRVTPGLAPKPKPDPDGDLLNPNPGPIRVWAGPGRAKPDPVPYLAKTVCWFSLSREMAHCTLSFPGGFGCHINSIVTAYPDTLACRGADMRMRGRRAYRHHGQSKNATASCHFA